MRWKRLNEYWNDVEHHEDELMYSDSRLQHLQKHLEVLQGEIESLGVPRPELRSILATYFNEGELRDLCFDLQVDYDSLPGSGKSDKARELVAYWDRQRGTIELTERIQRLRPHAFRQNALQKDTPERLHDLKMDKVLQEIEATQEKIADIGNRRIYDALLRLDYRDQMERFVDVIERQHIGAFLIQGAEKYGQRVLLNKLFRKIPRSTITNPIFFPLEGKFLRPNMKALWRQLGHGVGLQGSNLRDEVAARRVIERVSKQVQTGNVVLIFRDVDCAYATSLNEIIDGLWLPLVRGVQQLRSAESDGFLVMFLVDDKGCVGDWNVTFADQVDQGWDPSVPVKLPVIAPFSGELLAHWFSWAFDDLPLRITKQVEVTVQLILENSDGVPQRVLEYICVLCGCDWYEGEYLCLKL